MIVFDPCYQCRRDGRLQEKVLPEIFQLCRQGFLTVDQLLVEVHSGQADGEWRHSAASLWRAFYGAHHCSLMLFQASLRELHRSPEEMATRRTAVMTAAFLAGCKHAKVGIKLGMEARSK